VRACARELVAGLRGKGACDAATDYAQLIPTLTMCELLDLPKSERARFLRWNLDTLGSADFTSPTALRAYAEMHGYWQGLVAERRQRRGNDLISQILHHPVDGAALSDAEIAGFCSLLLDASQNTTMNMISHSLLALGRQPAARRALGAEPLLWPRALEELLRFVSPVQGLARTTTREITLHGTTLPAGEQVLLLYGSANHDETVFPNPDALDLKRDARSHWAFGHGIHHCLGNAVARLEVRVALEVLLEAIPDWEVDEAGVVLNQLVPTRGVAHAPIRWR
jgi:cytochrome P450